MARLGDRLYASLVTETLRVAQNASTSIIRASGAQATASFGAATGIDSIKIGDFVVPTDAHGQFWLHYAKPNRDRIVPAWKVLAGEAGEDVFDGTIVFVGTSAAGLKDLRTSPLDPAMPGIEAHAQAIEQILSGRFIDRPDWADGAEFLYIAALGLALVFALRRVGAAWSAAGWGIFAFFLAVYIVAARMDSYAVLNTIALAVLAYGGWIQGQMLNTATVPFGDIVKELTPWLVLRSFALMLLIIGHLAFLINYAWLALATVVCPATSESAVILNPPAMEAPRA